MKLQVPLLLWGMASPCLPCFLRAPPCYPSPQVGGSTDGCVPQSTRVPLPFPLFPFLGAWGGPVLLHSPCASSSAATVTCGLRTSLWGAGVGGWLHPGCFTPLLDLRWVWFRGPVPPELLAAIALFNVEQRQDEELA